ncbi:MAG: hypothetical protein OWU84_01540 [Firmicutes bacterium]|nr:hypothetical protein [Bacillota bacterium]
MITKRGWLASLISQLPVSAQRQGEDYLLQERLTRRWRRPPRVLSAELRGYRDIYHPVLGGAREPMQWECDCGRRGSACAHVAALLLDADRHPHLYRETPWALFVRTREWLTAPPLTWPDPWPWIPEAVLPWHLPFDQAALPTFLAAAHQGNPRATLDATWGLWADLHPSWLHHSKVRRAFDDWLSARLPYRERQPQRWVWLSWAQPHLPLAPALLALPESVKDPAVREALALLYGPALWRDATDARQMALLKVVTWLDSPLALELWRRFPQKPPWILEAADAFYQAGRVDLAQARLLEAWPDTPEGRRAARERLIAWLPPEDSLPHRLALALDTGSLDLLQPVRHLLNAEDWSQLTRRLGAPSPGAQTTDDRA